MRMLITLTVLLLISCLSVYADEDDGNASAGAAKADDCIDCHNTQISLKGRGAEAIIKQIQAIRAGDRLHPPGLDGLPEEDVADIAAYLDAL